MDKRAGEGAAPKGVLAGVWSWLVAPGDGPPPTPFDRAVLFVSRIAMWLTVVVVLITFYEVVMRYVFFSPTLWVNELSLWLGSAIFLTAGLYAMQRRAHIRVTAVYDLVSPRTRTVFDAVAALVVAAYATLMIVAGWDVALDTLLRWERFGTYWNPPIPATVKPLVLVVTFLVAAQAANNFFVDRVRGGRLEAGRGPGAGTGD